jgi:hypothetical protein
MDSLRRNIKNKQAQQPIGSYLVIQSIGPCTPVSIGNATVTVNANVNTPFIVIALQEFETVSRTVREPYGRPGADQ